jgi:DNA-binding SARP family transcriptional activator/tetratricopeptide (TPR) repeat protein
VEFRLLGPVELWARGVQLGLPSTKLKQLLAALLWDPGLMVPTVTLVRRMWDEDAPPRELSSLHSNISRLRSVLKQCDDPEVRLEHIPLGYRLLVPPESIDVFQCRRDYELARAAADRGRIEDAIRLLRSCGSLVHGEPLAGLPGSWAADKRGQLQEFAHDVTLLRIELELTVRPQDARGLLTELRRLSAERAFDESVLELNMRALHLAGRTTHALHVYGEFRTRLREHSGLDPRASVQRLYERLLIDEADANPQEVSAPPTVVHASSPITPAPLTLDRDPPGFVGRTQEINTLIADIGRQGESGPPAVCVIDGMPGIGKSTLALHLAHRLRGRCPDGALQLHLRGHDEHRGPTDPQTALDLLLGMLGVDPAQLQQTAGLDHSIALWRRYTAGKRLLLLLDDAAAADQVLPLVPTGSGSIVLVTARTRLAGLPEALRYALLPLRDAEAKDLFISAARVARTTDPALADIVAACGGFPLALSVAGNALRAHQSWSLSDLAEELADTRTSQHLDSVISPALTRSFATSYRDLPEFERMLLRRLSLNPGTRIHLRAVTALVDATPTATNNALYNLVEQNLLIEPTRRYYQMHDMIRLFGAHACDVDEEPAELEQAADRLARYVLDAVDSAARLSYPHRHVCLVTDPGLGESRHDYGFADKRAAATFLETEQEWLRTIAEHWFGTGRTELAGALTHMLASFLDRTSMWKESVPLHEAALQAWRETGHELGEAYSLVDLATAYWRLGALDRALECAQAALALWSRIEDPSGQADALLQIGRVHHSKHRHAASIAAFGQCAALLDRAGDRRSQAAALHHLGAVEFDAGHYENGIATLERALELAYASQDLAVQRNCINSLGNFRLRLGDYGQAKIYYQQALELADQIGDRRRMAVFAQNLGECETLLHRPEVAKPLLERAFELYQGLGSQHGQLDVMVAQAHAELELGRSRSAEILIDSAASLAEQLCDPLRLARVHLVYGHLYKATGKFPAAAEAYRASLSYARTADNRIMQGTALRHLGDLYEIAHGAGSARRYWRLALTHYGDFPSPEVDVLHGKLAAPTPPRRKAS